MSANDPVTINPQAGLEGDDLARAKASDANLAGIIAGRRRAARALLAPTGPQKALAARWSAILHPDAAIPKGVWGPSPDGVNYFHGHGAPTTFPPGAHDGDVYVDDDTNTAYRLET